METNLRIGALISGGGTNLQAIIDRCADGSVPGRIVFVGADNPSAKGLERARRAAIPTFAVDYRPIIARVRGGVGDKELPADFDLKAVMSKHALLPQDVDPQKAERFLKSRAIAEAGLLAAMRPYPFDLLVLAGYMRNLTPYFIDRVNTDPAQPRIMNIHPALLPAFPGQDGYGDTFRYGCKVAGCTVHFIDYGEDSGPIIAQRAFPIQESDTLESVRQKGLALEWEVYPQCIRWFAEGRLRLERRTPAGDGRPKVSRAIVHIH